MREGGENSKEERIPQTWTNTVNRDDQRRELEKTKITMNMATDAWKGI